MFSALSRLKRRKMSFIFNGPATKKKDFFFIFAPNPEHNIFYNKVFLRGDIFGFQLFKD